MLRETKVQGHPSTRKPDVQIVGPDGKTRKIFEAERLPSHERNLLREEEYRKLGIEFETHPVEEKSEKKGKQ